VIDHECRVEVDLDEPLADVSEIGHDALLRALAVVQIEQEIAQRIGDEHRAAAGRAIASIGPVKWEWLPRIRSAPAATRALRPGAAAADVFAVLGAPMRHDDHEIGAGRGRLDVGRGAGDGERRGSGFAGSGEVAGLQESYARNATSSRPALNHAGVDAAAEWRLPPRV